MSDLLDEAADEIMREMPHWHADGRDHMLDAGVQIAQSGTVAPLDTVREGRYRVGSRVVNMAAFSCECPEFGCQGTCRHIMAVLVYDRAHQMRAEVEEQPHGPVTGSS